MGNSFCKQSEYIYGENQLQDVGTVIKIRNCSFLPLVTTVIKLKIENLFLLFFEVFIKKTNV